MNLRTALAILAAFLVFNVVYGEVVEFVITHLISS